MDRPLADNRPFGPFLNNSGKAKIRYKIQYTTKQGAIETKQSLEQSITEEVNEDVPVSNVTLMTGSGDFMMEVGMDIDKKVLTDGDESMIQRAVGRSLNEGGVEDTRVDGIEQVAVKR
jgi:hypothetical protein